MKKSKEALEILRECANGEKKVLFSTSLELANIIKKDLERLETIENLRTTPNALETCLAKYMNKCIELEKENEKLKMYPPEFDGTLYFFEKYQKLEKENQDLKELQELNKQGLWNLKQENQKLEKAIEILKDKFDFKFNDENKVIYLFIKELSLHIYSWCFKSQQEYELLKEVLGNE